MAGKNTFQVAANRLKLEGEDGKTLSVDTFVSNLEDPKVVRADREDMNDMGKNSYVDFPEGSTYAPAPNNAKVYTVTVPDGATVDQRIIDTNELGLLNNPAIDRDGKIFPVEDNIKAGAEKKQAALPNGMNPQAVAAAQAQVAIEDGSGLSGGKRTRGTGAERA